MGGPGASTSFLNTITLSEFVDLTKKQFSHVNEMVETGPVMRLYRFDNLTSWSSQDKRYDELDIETFGRLKREGENAKKARGGVGYNKTMTARRIAMEVDVTWEMRRYGQEHKLKNDFFMLNHFVPQRRELDGTHRFTFATSTSYTDIDGEVVDTTMGDESTALSSSTQPLAFSSSTYSNRVSGDPAFSQGALETAEDLFTTDVVSNFNERRVVHPDLIVTTDTASLTNDVKQILESSADVDGQHAGIKNVNFRKYTHLVLPYLATTATGARDATKKRWWFLVSSRGFQSYFGEFEKPNMKTPVPTNGDAKLMGAHVNEDIHNDNMTFGVRGSHAFTILVGRGCVGSHPVS